MGKEISMHTKRELLLALRSRYQESSKTGKGRILDEFVAVSGYHRKHAIRLLSGKGCGETSVDTPSSSLRCGRRIYDETVRETLVLVWEATEAPGPQRAGYNPWSSRK